MAVQATRDNSNKPFILGGPGVTKLGTFAQIGERSGDLELYTLCSYNPTTQTWGPFTNAAATDGTQSPRGIVLQAITEAALQAGDVEDVPVLVADAIVDSGQLVIENDLTLETIVTVPTNNATSVEDELKKNTGIKCTTTINTTELA